MKFTHYQEKGHKKTLIKLDKVQCFKTIVQILKKQLKTQVAYNERDEQIVFLCNGEINKLEVLECLGKK